MVNVMNKIKITNHQLFSLTACSTFGGIAIVIASTITNIAKQDAWISAAITPVFGLLILWLMCSLGSLYPDMTFIEVIMKVFGKWIGWAVAASFILLCLEVSSHMPWYISSFVTSQAMPETPSYVIDAVFLTAVVIGVLYGIEAIARASEIFTYFVSFLFIVAMVLVLPSAKIENIFPIFEKGIAGSIKGSFILTNYSTLPLIVIMMIYPVNTSDLPAARKSIFKGYLWTGFLIFIAILMCILVLGAEISAGSNYPTYLLAKEINVDVVFTRFEFVIAAKWITTNYIICTLFFYTAVIGLSQLLGLKDYRKIVLPLGLIVLVMSEVVYPNITYERNWLNLVWPPYIITYALVLPVMLLLVYGIKKWIFKRM